MDIIQRPAAAEPVPPPGLPPVLFFKKVPEEDRCDEDVLLIKAIVLPEQRTLPEELESISYSFIRRLPSRAVTPFIASAISSRSSIISSLDAD